MIKDFERRNAGYFDCLAPVDDGIISSVPTNLRVRDGFRSPAAETAAPGRLPPDLGCGTGTDALWYVERGSRVIAYNSSQDMMEQLKAKCADPISRGRIIRYYTDYSVFLESEFRPSPEAVVSNFAVLSVIPDLPALFKALARFIPRGGYVIASLLNPPFLARYALPVVVEGACPFIQDRGD